MTRKRAVKLLMAHGGCQRNDAEEVLKAHKNFSHAARLLFWWGQITGYLPFETFKSNGWLK